jgi:hypothetical protein
MYSNTVKFPAQLFLYALNEKRQHAQTAGLFPPYFVTFSCHTQSIDCEKVPRLTKKSLAAEHIAVFQSRRD